MAISPGVWIDLLAPGLKQHGIKWYCDHKIQAWYFKHPNGSILCITKQWTKDAPNKSDPIDCVVSWVNMNDTKADLITVSTIAGINDYYRGIAQPVGFELIDIDGEYLVPPEFVQSIAKDLNPPVKQHYPPINPNLLIQI